MQFIARQKTVDSSPAAGFLTTSRAGIGYCTASIAARRATVAVDAADPDVGGRAAHGFANQGAFEHAGAYAAA
jgi:hypothetical protein